MNKWICLIFSLTILISCESKDDIVKEVIDNSYFGIYELNKMGDIEKSKEDIFSLAMHYTIVKDYIDIDNENKYVIVRHIYKTDKGANRIFYLIDITDRILVKKSSDPESFFLPMGKEILGENTGDLIGNNLFELYRY